MARSGKGHGGKCTKEAYIQTNTGIGEGAVNGIRTKEMAVNFYFREPAIP